MKAYRRELKYIVGKDTLLDTGNRISPLMKKDAHQIGDNYRIRSLYFDSPDLQCVRENAAGVSTREKYRVRIYNCDSSLLTAEIKIRHRDTISKMSAVIDRELFDVMVKGSPAQAAQALKKEASRRQTDTEKRVLEKYMIRFATRSYAPACIVDYERCAYVYDIANVRITFDTNVTASREYDRMFDSFLTGRAAIDGNRHVLEIKYDEFLPDEIASLLGGQSLSRSSCSKYALCMERIGVFI